LNYQTQKKPSQDLSNPIIIQFVALINPLIQIITIFFIKINTNPSKKLWLGLCLLDVVKKNNFMACSGFGKGTYAIDQSNGPSYSYNNPNNYATLSN
jgi:hypothetical protein